MVPLSPLSILAADNQNSSSTTREPFTMRSSITLLFALLVHPAVGGCGPLKVFLLDGQSNMVGMGSVQHLKILLNDTKTHNEYAHLWNETSNSWAERDDVYSKFNEHVGKLTVGFGAGHGNHFGAELEFGWVLGDSLCGCDKPILLLKTAWGGRNLAVDFRPPSSGKGNYTGIKPIHYGWEYRQMITDILATLNNNLPSIVPGYDDDVGYELAGFVWFQGWNDMLDWCMVAEYEYNLANLIRDVREDLEAPDMPFIIGELGMHGIEPEGRGRDRVLAMRKAERSVTLQDEFRSSTLFVPTAQYAVNDGTTYNGEYHYNGRADTYCHIGHAFGEAMLHLIGKNEEIEGELEQEAKLGQLRGGVLSSVVES